MVRDNQKKSEVSPLNSVETVDLRRDEVPLGAEQGPVLAPDPEVTTKGKRRVITAAYKARILRRADACTKTGELGALLRSEGVYSGQLSKWRHERDQGLEPQKRGRKRTQTPRYAATMLGSSVKTPVLPKNCGTPR